MLSSKLILLSIILPFTLAVSLPPYPTNTPYGVGLIDIEVPVQQPRNITNTTFTSNGAPAFFLQTVLFSLYYPISPGTNSTAPPHPWIGDPVDCVAAGIVAYANSSSVTTDLVSAGLNSVAGSVNIPAQADTPIANSSAPFPVLLFSVGDITLRTWYSQYAGTLAANGYVSAVIEHRDGSLACSVVEQKGQANQTVQYIQPNQLSSPVAGNETEMIMEQRSFRQAEVEETVRVLQAINSGQGQSIYQNNSRGEGASLSSWSGRFDFANLVMGGHSFGATLALQALSDSLIPAKGGLTFDPGKMSGPLNSAFNQSVLIPDSEAWSAEPAQFYGQQHFDVVKSIAQSALNKTGAGWFMTLLGTAHTSITDAPLLVGSLLGFFDPTSLNVTLADPEASLQQYVTVSLEYFQFLVKRTRSGVLASGVTTPVFTPVNLNASNVQQVFEGWEVHVAPPAGSNASSPGSSGGSGSGGGGSKNGAASIMPSLAAAALVMPALIGLAGFL